MGRASPDYTPKAPAQGARSSTTSRRSRPGSRSRTKVSRSAG